MWRNERFSRTDQWSLSAVMCAGIAFECLLFGPCGLMVGLAAVAIAYLLGAWIFFYRFRRLGKLVELDRPRQNCRMGATGHQRPQRKPTRRRQLLRQRHAFIIY